ncbi:MAG: magnesium transporter CorA family protein [Saccharofermentanales bacterium]
MLTQHTRKKSKNSKTDADRLIYVLTDPEDSEIEEVSKATGINGAAIKSALDVNALSRIHFNDIISVYIDMPYLLKTKTVTRVKKTPIGIFIDNRNLVLVSRKQIPAIEKILVDDKEYDTRHSILLLKILNHNAMLYIDFLDKIDRDTERLESSMKRRVTNKEIFQLMDNQRSLTGISTSLKRLEHLLERMKEHEDYFESDELLKDTEIAVKQASEMAVIFDADLDSLMDAFGSVLSNNVNQIMKILTALTLIIAIPTMIAGIFGMNVRLPLAERTEAFWLIIGVSAIASAITGVIFYFKKML